MVNKKGYFYFVEILFIVILLVAVILFFPRAETSHLRLVEQNNLKTTGFTALKNLDESGIFSKYIDPYSFGNSNFTALNIYVKQSLPSTIGSKLQYKLISSCYSETGAPENCGLNITGNQDATLSEYIFSKRPAPITIRLYLWRLL
ncbi:MAG: hypothetical protein QXH80_00565 [Candidatus Nanoarchaeia archaeon]